MRAITALDSIRTSPYVLALPLEVVALLYPPSSPTGVEAWPQLHLLPHIPPLPLLVLLPILRIQV